MASVVDFVIDPENGSFRAVWSVCSSGLKLLPIESILRWDKSEIVIANEKDLIFAEKASSKLQNILKKEVRVVGADVFVKNSQGRGKRIGRVWNLVFDTISPKILSLHVRGIFGIFWKKRIIPSSQILKISKVGIFVMDNLKHEKIWKFSERKKNKIMMKGGENTTEIFRNIEFDG